MKFAYVDESGDLSQSDVFVMVGCLVDAHSLRRVTADFDAMLKKLRARHPKQPTELKTQAFISGRKGWSAVPPGERIDFLKSVCQLAAEDCTLFASALSFDRFRRAIKRVRHHPPLDYWHAASMFVASLIQKKMQTVSKNKGHTVLVMDDNKAGMPALSDAIYSGDPWFDGLYQRNKKRRSKSVWIARAAGNRFDQIINTAFAIKSDHSSLVQVADALAYVYRRHLELRTAEEAYQGEKALVEELAGKIAPCRKTIGRCPDCEAVTFYRDAAPEGWTI